MKETEMKRVPKLRFPEFTDDWEQRKLGDIADIVGGGTPSTGNPSYWDGDIDWYAPAEIADQIYANSSQKKITDLGYENSSAKMLPPGTVLFTSRAGIGKTAILTRKGCTNQGFQSIVPHRGELDSYFIFSRTEELKRYGELVGAGSTFVEVSGKQMTVMELMMPPTMREQQTIGGFFQQLDHLITLHQRKLEKLKELRKGVMKKLFSQEVRFKADDGSEFSEWEKKKIGDVFSKIKDKNKDGRNQNVITNSAEFGLINQRDFFDKDIAVYGKTENYTVIKTGDFVYNPRKSKQAPYGPFNCYQLEENGIVSPLYTCLRPKSNVNDKYLLWYFKSGSWYRFIYENGAQNGARHDRVGMTDSLMQEIPVYLPQAVEEQQKIAECLSALDDVIEKQKATLAAWEELKKGLLQQMFV